MNSFAYVHAYAKLDGSKTNRFGVTAERRNSKPLTLKKGHICDLVEVQLSCQGVTGKNCKTGNLTLNFKVKVVKYLVENRQANLSYQLAYVCRNLCFYVQQFVPGDNS